MKGRVADQRNARGLVSVFTVSTTLALLLAAPFSPARAETASSGTSCSSTPLVGCRTAAKGQLKLKHHSNPSKAKLTWKWSNGQTTVGSEFGDPVGGTTGYQICVYDETASTPVHLATFELGTAGQNCPTKPCWKAIGSGSGFKFADRDKSYPNTGIAKLQLVGKAGNKSKIQMQAKGVNLEAALPGPFDAQYFDQDVDVTIQLTNTTTSVCWETVLPGPAGKNDFDDFSDKF